MLHLKKKGGSLIFSQHHYIRLCHPRGVSHFIFSFHFHSVSCTFWRAPADLLVLISKDLGCSTEEHIKRFKLGFWTRAVEGRQKIVSGRNRNLATGWPWNPGHRNPSIHALRPIRQSFINFSARFFYPWGSLRILEASREGA